MIKAAIIPPRLLGLTRPSKDEMSTPKSMVKSWAPAPFKAQKRLSFVGTRNTSACTSFHPESSSMPLSSPVSRSMYREKSRLRMRSMTMERNATSIMTRMNELMTEIQCSSRSSWNSPWTTLRSA